MPYFRWRGITMIGETEQGTMFAISVQDLDATLFKNGVALLQSNQMRTWYWRNNITLKTRINFLLQLSKLVSAGILLPNALGIIAAQTPDVRLQAIVKTILHDLQQGIPLEKSCEQYPYFFNPLMITMIASGNRSGNLSAALEHLATHLLVMESLTKKLKSAALLPTVTFVFFIGISAALFLYVVPTFISLIAATTPTLPPLTNALLQVSLFFQSWASLGIIGGFFLCTYALCKTKFFPGLTLWRDTFLLKTPGIKKMICASTNISFFRSLALLLEGGIAIVPALEHAQYAINNTAIQQKLAVLIPEIQTGNSLSQALSHQAQLFESDTLAMVRVGEESGNLPEMLNRLADQYQEDLQESIGFVTTLFQPALVIILGLLIGLLVMALYIPLFNLAHAL